MLIGLLVVSIILLILFIVGFVFVYSFYFNANNKLYHKLKFNYSSWGMFGLLIFIFLLTAIILTISYTYSKDSLIHKNLYLIPISWILFLFSVILLITIILIKNKINKTRLEMSNFRQEDFRAKLVNLNQMNYKKLVEKKYPRYFSILKQKQQIIGSMMKNFSPDKYQNILTELIMFNETSSTK